MTAFRVLIVDDVKSNIMVMSKCLQDVCEVITAGNGQDCLALAKSYPQPDLILLDIRMPGMDGYSVCRQLKSDPQTESITVIFVTGNDSDEAEEIGLTLGAIDYITKPVRPAIVRARVAVHMQLKQQRDKLQFMAMHDQLTGLFNRYFLVENAEVRLAHFRRHKTPFCAVLLDIDEFKAINDKHGHDVGDEVLVATAQMLKDYTRREDIVARLGGEEMVILMECPFESALNKVENLRARLEALMPAGIRVTASFGVVEATAQCDELHALLKLADECVYHSKSTGRNQVISVNQLESHRMRARMEGH
ncbi:GGDEF domain-containing response regulator [Shewanella sp. GXUN23E]|uniref:GGDEF domain-containing response regulator n=1 Tax=Shewanella sp. GXUN23E TaxID=3422498 RepID=UPI003D7D788B